jgi:hypothetical protein
VEKINEVQEHLLWLMEHASFNAYDGERVVTDLREHLDLWEAALMDRIDHLPLLKLRDVPDDYWNVETLCILTTKDRVDDLLRIVDTWGADEVSIFVDANEVWNKLGGILFPDAAIIEAWWD